VKGKCETPAIGPGCVYRNLAIQISKHQLLVPL
jgi:hypothetical protein